VLPATAATWADDLWHDPRFSWADPQQDAGRIREAFRIFRRNADRWPTLADFARSLPHPPTLAAIAHRPCTPEQAAANLTRLKSMVSEIFGADRD
jgi:hypothetical protein